LNFHPKLISLINVATAERVQLGDHHHHDEDDEEDQMIFERYLVSGDAF
jgi:hypothetical protein